MLRKKKREQNQGRERREDTHVLHTGGQGALSQEELKYTSGDLNKGQNHAAVRGKSIPEPGADVFVSADA